MYEKINDYICESDIIQSDIYNRYDEFGVSNKYLFEIIVNMYLHLYKKTITAIQEVRTEQDKFRKGLIQRYKHCLITEHIIEECEACHIKPHADGGDYSIDNGILLDTSIHKTFDLYKWSINPDTLEIDILCDDKSIVGSIYDYVGKKVDIQVNNIMYNNLQYRWNEYMKRKSILKN